MINRCKISSPVVIIPVIWFRTDEREWTRRLLFQNDFVGIIGTDENTVFLSRLTHLFLVYRYRTFPIL